MCRKEKGNCRLKWGCGTVALGRVLLVMILSATCGRSFAQGDVAVSQYWSAPTFYNPAAVGTDGENLRLRAGSRLQWVGVERAPKLFFGTGDMQLGFVDKRLGGGVVINQESLGLFTNTGVAAQGSYSLALLGGKLSAGVQLGYYNSKFRGSEVVLPGDGEGNSGVDEAIPTQDLVGQTVDAGVGVWYSRPNFWTGVSVMHLTEPTISLGVDTQSDSGVSQFETVLRRGVYFMVGGNIPVKNTLFQMQPSLFLRNAIDGIGGEANLRASYNRFLTVGCGYRYKEAVTAMVGVEVRNFFAGYSFEYPLSALARVSGGSHEIVVGYSLKVDFGGENKYRHKSIRFM